MSEKTIAESFYQKLILTGQNRSVLRKRQANVLKYKATHVSGVLP